MFGFIKRQFIPHEVNEHKPHFLRGKTMLFVAIVVTFFEDGSHEITRLSVFPEKIRKAPNNNDPFRGNYFGE